MTWKPISGFTRKKCVVYVLCRPLSIGDEVVTANYWDDDEGGYLLTPEGDDLTWSQVDDYDYFIELPEVPE